MTTQTMWGPREDDDHLGNPAKIAMFDMPEQWDPQDDPHPNTKLMNSFMDFGKKYINSDPSGGTGFAAIPDTYDTGRAVKQNSSYTPPSQQANNQGLIANVTKTGIQPTMENVSYSTSVTPKATVVQYTASGNTLPETGSAFTRSLDSVNAGNVGAATATPDLIGAIGGQYLKQGNHDAVAQTRAAEATATPDFLKATTRGYLQGRHDVVPASQQVEATATADLLKTAGQETGNLMMRTGSDKAAHDSETNYNLHFSQDPEGYRKIARKTLNDSGNAWLTTDDEYNRRNIEKNADNVALMANDIKSRGGRRTSQAALAINNLVTIGSARYKNNVILANELRQHRADWENNKAKMMTPKDIRMDSAENFANDMESYLSQTAIGTHLVNMVKVRAYRGATFMMSNAVDFIDKSFDVWADNIVERGDQSYLNAFRDTLKQNDVTTNDVFINVIAKCMGGVNGDALIFFWDSLKETDKHIMMKQVRKRQKAKQGVTEQQK